MKKRPSNLVLYSHHHQAATPMDANVEIESHHQSLKLVMILNDIIAWVPIKIPLKPITVMIKRHRECGLKKNANSTFERGKNQKLVKTRPMYVSETIYRTTVCSINNMIKTNPKLKIKSDK